MSGSSTGIGAAAAEAAAGRLESAGRKVVLLQADIPQEDQARAITARFVEAAEHVLMKDAGAFLTAVATDINGGRWFH